MRLLNPTRWAVTASDSLHCRITVFYWFHELFKGCCTRIFFILTYLVNTHVELFIVMRFFLPYIVPLSRFWLHSLPKIGLEDIKSRYNYFRPHSIINEWFPLWFVCMNHPECRHHETLWTITLLDARWHHQQSKQKQRTQYYKDENSRFF